ncbi:NUDIX domain-containing protein [Bacillus sp. SCS-151]|uniref:NUDIX domain-containing protein n=1 Tax=Nanhaiella sioensis TaxID=3115293 RepID=UPI00397A13DB
MIRKSIGAIVYQGNKFLIVQKTNINTLQGIQNIKAEWDFIKGGVEKNDKNLHCTLFRELKEETGSIEYKVVKVFKEKICFDFPDDLKEKIGYDKKETTMFLVEFLGDINDLMPNYNEISKIKFIEKDKVVEILTHQDTKDYFTKYSTV